MCVCVSLCVCGGKTYPAPHPDIHDMMWVPGSEAGKKGSQGLILFSQ